MKRSAVAFDHDRRRLWGCVCKARTVEYSCYRFFSEALAQKLGMPIIDREGPGTQLELKVLDLARKLLRVPGEVMELTQLSTRDSAYPHDCSAHGWQFGRSAIAYRTLFELPVDGQICPAASHPLATCARTCWTTEGKTGRVGGSFVWCYMLTTTTYNTNNKQHQQLTTLTTNSNNNNNNNNKLPATTTITTTDT
eukprot:5404243-Amphidinium_carterae.1